MHICISFVLRISVSLYDGYMYYFAWEDQSQDLGYVLLISRYKDDITVIT